MRSLLVAAAMLGSVTAAFAADPVGTYDASGKTPGGKSYSGTVTIEKTGQTYKVTWEIGDSESVGTAIGNAGFMAVTYKSGGVTGLVLYAADGGNWNGIWTRMDGTTMGTETLKRQ